MANKRVLIFSLAYFPLVGGAEVAVKEITDRLRDVRFDMITKRFDRSNKEFEAIGNIHVHRIGGPKNLYPFKAFLLARKLHKKEPYDMSWAIMANWAGFAALFFKMAFPKVKFVLTLQEGDPIGYIKKKVLLVYPLFRKIFLKADVIQTISNYLADWARDMGYKGRVEVIPNGVDLTVFGIPSKKLDFPFNYVHLVTISRLVKKNGIEDIITALNYLPDNPPIKYKLVIFGDGPLEKELKTLTERYNLSERVQFFGQTNHQNIINFFQKQVNVLQIFIRPSLSEGMGNSFIEAMAAGLPVIATPVGGIVDFLVDPDKSPHKAPTGLYVAVHDPEGIAMAVKRLMKDARLRETLITNGKRLVRERYDWDLIAEEMRKKVFA